MSEHLTGILLLDKPIGLTSNAVLQQVKKRLGAKKAGHTGTLDPLASGMLPICLGESTKIIRFLLEANKSYEVTMRLGITTTTLDSEGEIVEQKAVPHLSLEAIETLLAGFRGSIEQLPPVYSALKQNGQRFYQLARQGRASEIERKVRHLQIDELKLIAYDYQDSVTAYLRLTIHCSKGTYIRSMVSDIGEKMGCGAHVVALRRLFVDPFKNYPMIQMQDVGIDSLLPTYFALPQLPKIYVSPEAVTDLYLGKKIACGDTDSLVDWVQLWKKSGETFDFFGIGHKCVEGIAPKRLFQLAACAKVNN